MLLGTINKPMLEFLFEIFGDLIFQVILSVLGELFSGAIGSRVSSAADFRPAPPSKALLYLLAGSALGGLSLWLFPHAVTHTPDTRLTVLIGTPLFCGLIMGAIGGARAKRVRHSGAVMRLPSFAYGALFAAPMSAARFIWAH